jgi:hypothetical protein
MAEPPFVRTTFPKKTGVDGGEFTSSTPMKLSENCDAATMLVLTLNYQHQVREVQGAPPASRHAPQQTALYSITLSALAGS